MPSYNRLALKSPKEMEKTKRKDHIYNKLERISTGRSMISTDDGKMPPNLNWELRRMINLHYQCSQYCNVGSF